MCLVEEIWWVGTVLLLARGHRRPADLRRASHHKRLKTAACEQVLPYCACIWPLLWFSTQYLLEEVMKTAARCKVYFLSGLAPIVTVVIDIRRHNNLSMLNCFFFYSLSYIKKLRHQVTIRDVVYLIWYTCRCTQGQAVLEFIGDVSVTVLKSFACRWICAFACMSSVVVIGLGFVLVFVVGFPAGDICGLLCFLYSQPQLCGLRAAIEVLAAVEVVVVD